MTFLVVIYAQFRAMETGRQREKTDREKKQTGRKNSQREKTDRKKKEQKKPKKQPPSKTRGAKKKQIPTEPTQYYLCVSLCESYFHM